MTHPVPVREQTIIYLVNKLRQAFKAYCDSGGFGATAEQALADFNEASQQLDAIGVRGDPASP